MQPTLFNIMILGTSLAVVILVPLRGILRSRSGSFSGTARCMRCNHDRRNIPADRPCPECGTSPGIKGTGIEPDKDIVICRACGQSLEGLAWDTTCPECGLPNAALPRFHKKQQGRLSPGRLLDSFLILLWAVSLLILGSQIF
jgi:hypothetical protein